MPKTPSYRFAGFELRPATRELLVDGGPVALTSRAFDCLLYLIEHRDRAVGRDELAAAVWGRVDVSDAQLSQSILRARKAVGDAGAEQLCIRTVHKFGYHWVAETHAVEIDGGAAAQSQAVPAAPVPVPDGVEARTSKPADGTGAPVTVPLPVDGLLAAPPARRPLSTWPLLIAGLVLSAAMAVLFWWRSHPAPVPDVAQQPAMLPVLVLPVEVPDGSGADWIRLGAIDVVANRMRGAGFPVPPSETMIALLRAREQRDSGPALEAEAEWVVRSRAARSARGWRVALEATGQSGVKHVSETETQDVLDAFRMATDGLLRQLGHLAPDALTLPTAVEEPLQRAQAALLENDFDAARKILSATPALLADAPELRFQLALVDYRAGRLADVEPALRKLLDDQDMADRNWLKARAHTMLGSVDMMLDRAQAAEAEFETALRLISFEQYPLDHARALSGRGAARATQERYEEGLKDLGQARLELQRSGDALAQARMDLMIGSLENIRRRPAAARPVLVDAITRLRRFAAWNELLHGYSDLIFCDLALLDYQSAEANSQAALAVLPKVKNGLHLAENVLTRIYLKVRQGRLREARELFAELEQMQLPAHPRFDGIGQALRAALASWEGDHRTVITTATRAIDLLPINEKELAAQAVLLRQRAWLAEGEVDAAERALAALKGFLAEGEVPIPILLARAELQRVRSGRTPELDAFYQQTLDRAERAAIPADRLLVTESWLGPLLEAEQYDLAGGLVGRMIPIAEQDFRFALLELKLSHSLKRTPEWTLALQRAHRLAGERTIPEGLQQPPAAPL